MGRPPGCTLDIMDLASLELDIASLTALTKASAAINSSLEPQEVLERIASSAASVMRAEASSVLTYDKRREKLVFSAAIGPHRDKLLGKEFDARLGIAGKVLRSGTSVNVDDVSSSPEFFEGIDQLTKFQTRGLLAAPMIWQSDVVGVVEVINSVAGGQFTPNDVKLLQVFADLAAAAVRNALIVDDLRRQNRAFRAATDDDRLVGTSPAFQETMKLARRVAGTNSTVLLLGETGTGKEVLARFIHRASHRADRPFVAVNCAALPETLLESELFGHEKGAFTGAISQHTGRFELADRGTLFLDEIGELSASVQVKLLRILQEREFNRLGGTRTLSCDVRILAATNRDLKKSIEQGSFRDDLFYRLNVFPITMPPLRERREDVPALAAYFVDIAAKNLNVPKKPLDQAATARLISYSWPGNIRELANVIERAVLLCDSPVICVEDLPREIAGATEPGEPGEHSLPASERAMIMHALRTCDWNQSAAARTLGISRDNLRYRIKKYGIRRDQD